MRSNDGYGSPYVRTSPSLDSNRSECQHRTLVREGALAAATDPIGIETVVRGGYDAARHRGKCPRWLKSLPLQERSAVRRP